MYLRCNAYCKALSCNATTPRIVVAIVAGHLTRLAAGASKAGIEPAAPAAEPAAGLAAAAQALMGAVLATGAAVLAHIGDPGPTEELLPVWYISHCYCISIFFALFNTLYGSILNKTRSCACDIS